MDRLFSCNFDRRFGIELEINPLNGIVRRPNSGSGETSFGTQFIARIISKALMEKTIVQDWNHVHNNQHWVIKPDNSCGIEVNTPVLFGWHGLKQVMIVSDLLKRSGLHSDKKCSFHIHINTEKLNALRIASVISQYIKCEHIFFDSIPSHRKNSRYCQFLSMTNKISCSMPMDYKKILSAISDVKYYSINVYHMLKGGGVNLTNNRKKTIEFRIAEGSMCLNPWDIKNWVRLLMHFVEVTSKKPMPNFYDKNDRFSSLLWIDPVDMFDMLGFLDEDYLSPGLKQTRDWFINRIKKNGYNTGLDGIWSNDVRKPAWDNFNEMINNLNVDDQTVITREMLYGSEYIE